MRRLVLQIQKPQPLSLCPRAVFGVRQRVRVALNRLKERVSGVQPQSVCSVHPLTLTDYCDKLFSSRKTTGGSCVSASVACKGTGGLPVSHSTYTVRRRSRRQRLLELLLLPLRPSDSTFSADQVMADGEMLMHTLS